MTLKLLHSEFPYIWGKLVFLFYQCTWLDLIYTWLDLIEEPDACEDDEDATRFSSFLHSLGWGLFSVEGGKNRGHCPWPPPPSTFFQTSCVSLNHCQETIKNLCFFKDTMKRLDLYYSRAIPRHFEPGLHSSKELLELLTNLMKLYQYSYSPM